MSNKIYDQINAREYARFGAKTDAAYAKVVAGTMSSEEYEAFQDLEYEVYLADVDRLYSKAIVAEAESKLEKRLAEIDAGKLEEYDDEFENFQDDGADGETEFEQSAKITADEAAKLLNCTRAVLFAAIRAGRVRPPDEKGLFALDVIRKTRPARPKAQRPRPAQTIPRNVLTSILDF